MFELKRNGSFKVNTCLRKPAFDLYKLNYASCTMKNRKSLYLFKGVCLSIMRINCWHYCSQLIEAKDWTASLRQGVRSEDG